MEQINVIKHIPWNKEN